MRTFRSGIAEVKNEPTKYRSKICHRTGGLSNADCSCLFLSMFPDSNIAKKYHLDPDKLLYSVNFGFGPYFKNIFMESIRKSFSY